MISTDRARKRLARMERQGLVKERNAEYKTADQLFMEARLRAQGKWDDPENLGFRLRLPCRT